MSFYTDMKQCALMVNKPKTGLSGAQKDDYVFLDNVDATIYKNNAFKNVSTVKYQESTHNGLTYFKDFEDGKEYQLITGNVKYQVLDFNTTGRQTTLLLKRIIFYE